MDCTEHFTDSGTLFISFASMGEGDPHGCHFEWKKHLHDDLGYSVVLIRDPQYHWYQDGIGGLGDVERSVEYVRTLNRIRPRVIAMGVSMGGFGALLYGILAEIPEIIALAPQTVIGTDPRWRDNWMHISHRPYPDIAALLPCKSEIKVYIGNEAGQQLDFAHYDRIKFNCYLRQVPGCEHATLARTMRDNGYFRGFA